MRFRKSSRFAELSAGSSLPENFRSSSVARSSSSKGCWQRSSPPQSRPSHGSWGPGAQTPPFRGTAGTQWLPAVASPTPRMGRRIRRRPLWPARASILHHTVFRPPPLPCLPAWPGRRYLGTIPSHRPEANSSIVVGAASTRRRGRGRCNGEGSRPRVRVAQCQWQRRRHRRRQAQRGRQGRVGDPATRSPPLPLHFLRVLLEVPPRVCAPACSRPRRAAAAPGRGQPQGHSAAALQARARPQ